jgi:hypothetical protein
MGNRLSFHGWGRWSTRIVALKNRAPRRHRNVTCFWRDEQLGKYILAGRQIITHLSRLPSPMSLPTFRYHPDPIATGSIIASDETCLCCEQERGYKFSCRHCKQPKYGLDFD